MNNLFRHIANLKGETVFHIIYRQAAKNRDERLVSELKQQLSWNPKDEVSDESDYLDDSEG